MLIDILEQLDPIVPLGNFSVQGEIPYLSLEDASLSKVRKKVERSDLSLFRSEDEPITPLFLGWNEKGLFVYIEVPSPVVQVEYPQFSQGDALELFIDTRGLLDARFFHSFCHQFLFLPREVRGMQTQEISVFRQGEGHPLCDKEHLKLEVQEKKGSYEMGIWIAAPALYGFNPEPSAKLGFMYRLHRSGKKNYSFCSDSSHFFLEQQPRLWANFSLQASAVNRSKKGSRGRG